MTSRLIALMCGILFLSLLAFSLLLDHSRAAVLDEVERTVSTVGDQTLHAFIDGMATETQGVAKPAGAPFPPGTVIEEQRELHIRGQTDLTPEQKAHFDEALRDGDIAFKFFGHDQPILTRPDGSTMRVAILLTRLPDLRVAPSGGEWHGPAPALHDQLVFDVQTGQYEAVFDAIQRRSLWLFLGIFLVGTVLVVAVARRFTQPIRQLDQALQQIAAGDLDVEVRLKGGDEIGRLGLAFNAMTAQLREGRERAREMMRREKLSALGRLAAGVAHDVRNPLQSINLTLQHLEEIARPPQPDAPDRSAFDRAVALIRREIKRLDGLVTNFLGFARSDRQEKQPVAVAELLRETAQLIAKEAERRGVQVVIDAERDAPPVKGHVESLRSALLNLVLNGMEAMEKGGTLTLRARASDAATMTVEVIDTGKGIPEADLERVFDFGYTTRESGHGLGLAMVHHIVVLQHGGRIAIDSAIGQGTTVRIELPTGKDA